MSKLSDEQVDALDRVMNTWPGTVEELGADLYLATRASPWGLTEQVRQDCQEQTNDARRRIEDHDGGRQLIELELEMFQ